MPPFENTWPTPLGPESKLDPADLDQFSQITSRLADGRVWSDISVVKNWKKPSTAGPGTPNGRSIVYDPKSRRWIVFGISVAPESYWTISGALWHQNTANMGSPAFQSFAGSSAASPDGVILVGGRPATASTAKLRESSDGGETWTVRNIGLSDVEGISAIAYVRSLGLWIVVLGGVAGSTNGIYTSTDRINWTRRHTAVPFHLIIREADPGGKYGPMILGTTPQQPGFVGAYLSSTDGINWVVAPFPENPSGVTCQGSWNYGHQVFALGTFQGIWTSRTGREGSWKLVNDTFAASGTTTTAIASFGRLFIRGDGMASGDGGKYWFPVLETSNLDLFIRAEEGIGVYVGRPTVNEHRLSYLVGL